MSIELVNGHVLFSQPPNWQGGVQVVRRWETQIGGLITGAEDRGAMRQVPLLELSYLPSILTQEQRARDDDALFAALQSGLAVAPLWGRASDLASNASGNSATLATTTWPWAVGDYIFLADFTDLEHPVYAVRQLTAKSGLVLTLNSALPQTFTTGSLVWPLIFGHPVIDGQGMLTSRQTSGKLTITERVGSTRAGASAAPTYLSRPIFTPTINWTDGVNRRLAFDLNAVQIGFGAEVFAPLQGHVINGFEFGVQLNTETDIRALDDFFASLHGRLQGFWLPAPVEAFDIATGVSATVCDITAQGWVDTWQNHPAIHLWFNQDGATGAAKILSVVDNGNGTERVTLDTALPFIPDASTLVSRLHYVRLVDDDEKWNCLAEWFDRRSMRVVELPEEYTTAETGEQPIYLYHIWIDTTPVTQHWYYTSFAAALTSNAHSYTPKPISHDNLKSDLTGSAQKVSIDAYHEAGHPFLFGFPYPPQRPINVQILETTYGAPDATKILFTGRVDKAPRKGKQITAECVSLLDLDAQKLPDALIGPRCAFQIFDLDTCGLNRAAFQKAGAISSINGRVIRVTHATNFNQPLAQHFTFGWIEVGTNATQEFRSILSDTIISTTVRELTLDLPLQHAAVNDAVVVLPGCDGKWDTCRLKFLNDRYLGAPFVPKQNPTLTAIDQPVSRGGKK